jgi:hypothetical protein
MVRQEKPDASSGRNSRPGKGNEPPHRESSLNGPSGSKVSPSSTGRAPLNYGIGVHVGDVMYGNIGSRTRLDFRVIGPAVNMASRLETLTKQLGRTVLLSRSFADFVESDFDLERVGDVTLSLLAARSCNTLIRSISVRLIVITVIGPNLPNQNRGE